MGALGRVTPEESRRSHSIGSALRAALTDWYPISAPVVAWMVHLVGLASFVRLSCEDSRWLWVMHGITALTLAATALALGLSWRLARGDADTASASEAGHRRFLGQFGLLVAASSALLIVVEELLVFAFGSQRCG